MCMHVHTCVDACVHVCTHVCVCVCTVHTCIHYVSYTCTHVHTCVHTHVPSVRMCSVRHITIQEKMFYFVESKKVFGTRAKMSMQKAHVCWAMASAVKQIK